MSHLPEHLQAARLRCADSWPYLAAGLWNLVPVETKGLGTLGVDKYWRLYYDPDLKWTAPQTATVLYHEMMHLLRSHGQRAECIVSVDHNAFNYCADAEINDDLETEGRNITWPCDPVTPKTLGQANGLLAEEYYQALPKLTIKQISQGTGKPGAGDCGSAADGRQRPHEKGTPSGQGADRGIESAESEMIRRHVAQEVINETQKGRGTVPGHMQEWAKRILHPQVDWRKVLRAQVKHSLADIAGKRDYTWKKPSRRSSAFPRIILPSMFSPVPRVSVVIDTSGSMSKDDLEYAVGEIGGILKACGQQGSIQVIACDAAVHSAKRVWRANQVELLGRGGTDMRVGINVAMRERIKPHLIVVLTDGDTPWPSEPVRAKLIVALIGAGEGMTKNCPEWAKVVKVEKNK